MIRNSFYTFALLALAAGAVRADKVDELVNEHLKKTHAPAASIAVIRNGKVVKLQGYGLANVELNVPASDNTVYQIGSITKQFTAVAVMQLVEAGKLRVDEAVSTILPDLPKSWSGVTVRHLLTHTSGIKSYTSLPNFGDMARKDVKHADVVKSVGELPLEFQPGEKWNYNNTGYYLLGMVVEKLSGKSYGAYLQEKVFAPLEMASTRANDLSAVIPNRAAGYTRQGSEVRVAPFISMSWPYSAGVLVSTVGDLAKWDAAAGTEKLLKKSSWEMVWSPVRLNSGSTHPYGFGWALSGDAGRKTVEHGGGIPGFTTNIVRYAEDGLTVIVLTNSDAGNPGSLTKAIAREFVPALLVTAKGLEDKDPAVTKLVKDVLLQTADGTLKKDVFTAEMAADIFPDKVKGAAGFLSSQGTLEKLTLVGQKQEGDIRSFEYLAKFKLTSLRIRLSLDKVGKIAGFQLSPE